MLNPKVRQRNAFSIKRKSSKLIGMAFQPAHTMRFSHYMFLHIIMQLRTSSGSLKLAKNLDEAWDVFNFITSKEPAPPFSGISHVF